MDMHNDDIAVVSNQLMKPDEKKYWDEAYGGMKQYLGFSCHGKIVEFLARTYDVIGKDILDVGGGPGIHAKELSRIYFSNCVNMDYSAYALSFFQHEVRCVHHDLADLPWIMPEQERRFDIIISIQVLEHIDEYKIYPIAQEMRKWLKPGGYCFLSVAVETNTQDKTHVCLKPLSWWYEQFLVAGFGHDYLREKVASRESLPQNLGWQCLYLVRD